MSTFTHDRDTAAPAAAVSTLEDVARQMRERIEELAEFMEIGPTYLYKVLPSMEREGLVRKVGHGYEAVE